jgi:hypothetical protein
VVLAFAVACGSQAPQGEIVNGAAASPATASESCTTVPVVRFDGSDGQGVAPDTEDLDGTESHSTCADHWIAACHWDFGDGSSTAACWAEHVYTVPGSYTAKFTATDNVGTTGSATLIINVTAPGSGQNIVAVARFDGSDGTGTAPDTEDLDGTLSYSKDPNVWIDGCHWDFGDGSASDACWAEHVYQTPGDYVARFTAHGSDGETASTTLAIHVTGSQANECDGLLPSVLPSPVVATLPQNGCLDGTSDDGTGNYMLGYRAGTGPDFPAYRFFTIQDGKAVPIGGTQFGGDENGTYVYSQPSGFTAFNVVGATRGSAINNWSHDGNLMSSRIIATGSFTNPPSSAIGIDPSGGIATLVHTRDPNQDVNDQTVYQRLDKTGAPESQPVILDKANNAAAAIGVALSGHALAIEGTYPGFIARWVAKDGTPITEWFALPSASGRRPVVRFLMDGGVAVGFDDGSQTLTYANVQWSFEIQDGKTAVNDVPAWLQSRRSSVWYVIRNGRGYAAWGGPSCASDRIEVLAASGRSCGCTASVPNLRATIYASIGRDGSLIVPHDDVGSATCRVDLYPQLLK